MCHQPLTKSTPKFAVISLSTHVICSHLYRQSYLLHNYWKDSTAIHWMCVAIHLVCAGALNHYPPPSLYWSRNEGLGWAILHMKVNRAFSCDVITFQSTKENGTATMLVFKKTVASMAILANGSSMCWIGQYTTAMYQRFICGVFNCYYCNWLRATWCSSR